jgi:hypothetical protein
MIVSVFIVTYDTRAVSLSVSLSCVTLVKVSTKGRDLIGLSENCYFAEVEQFSLEKIFLSKYANTNTSFLGNTCLWKLLRVLSFLALPVPCIPMKVARGPGNEDAYNPVSSIYLEQELQSFSLWEKWSQDGWSWRPVAMKVVNSFNTISNSFNTVSLNNSLRL